MNILIPSPLLRKALVADAVVSGASALLQVSLPGTLAGFTALPVALLSGTGIFLVAYTALLIAMARSATLHATLVWLVVIGNLLWALGCAALWAGGAVTPSLVGGMFLAAQMLAVLVFAALEFAGLRASVPASSAHA